MTDLHGKRIKRDGTADLLKGFAVLFMIQVHLMEQFVSPDIYSSLIGKTSMFLGGPFCAPVFLAVMGYFLAYSSKPLFYFLKRGVLLFLGGILLNTARSANLLIQIIQGKLELDPWFYILGADILTLAGLSLLLTGIMRIMFREKAWLYAISAIIVAAISPLLNRAGSTGLFPSHFRAFLWGTEAWSYFPVFPWFAYVLAGYSFRLFLKQSPVAMKIDIQTRIIYFIPAWIGVIITIPFASAITHNLDGPDGYYHHGILFFGWVLLFLLSYLVVVKLIEINCGENRILGFVKWIGQKVTMLYIIQWLIIGNLATWLFHSQGLFQFIGWFFLVTIATILTGLLVDKIRLP